MVRFFCGILCDRFGPRLVFVGLLLCGAIPTALAGCVTGAKGLIALRFFVGILGGTFVPCQVWSTGFFDKEIVGSANALSGGLGNSGGGITYFVMPAVFNSLVRYQHLTPHVAWRVAYVIPFIIITAVALIMLFTCPDTPRGKWSERHNWHKNVVDNDVKQESLSDLHQLAPGGLETQRDAESQKIKTEGNPESRVAEMTDTSGHEGTMEYTRSGTLRVAFSLSTMALALPYACSFGSELSMNNMLSTYYLKNFPYLGQTEAGNWAAMFGLLNVVCRPAGGFISDALYRATRTVWSKKILLVSLGIIMGAFELAVGLSDPKSEATMFGLMAGLAFFLEATNGANFSLVPHAHPSANGSWSIIPLTLYNTALTVAYVGIVSGTVGAMGNLGGIIFAIILRYNNTNYARALWIIGVISIAVNLALCWSRPVSKWAL